MSRIKLAVQADDFGMCHAVNQGVERAFRDGILTQAVMMVPCPAFEAAADLALRDSIPVGLHSTLTSEWENVRWGPLSGSRSLAEADGTFHRTVESARAKLDVDEAMLELEMQAQRIVECGLDLLYVDAHMGLICREAYQHVCRRFDRPFLFPWVENHLDLTSFQVLSPRHAAIKRTWLLDYLSALTPGNHFLQTHPGVAGDELRCLTKAKAPNIDWAVDYRVSDLALLTSPSVVARVEELGIELVTVAEFFPSKAAAEEVASSV